MNNKTSNHPENAKSEQQICITCKHYMPCREGSHIGRCMQLAGAYGKLTRYDYFCGRHKQLEAEQQHADEQQPMHKIAYNSCFGGFNLSREAILWLGSHGIYDKYPGIKDLNDLPRHEPLLIQCIDELGEAVNESEYNKIKIAEIDSDVYYIEDYDGYEIVITPKDMIKIEQ